jgi:DNA-binding NarL/FixJ family response regulator
MSFEDSLTIQHCFFMESSKIDICVVDDHHLFRKALCQLLKTFPRIGAVNDAENGKECLELVAKKRPQVVLLDLEMPIMNGVECAEQLIPKYPDLKIIILSMHDNEKSILHMIEIGVNSFLLKNSDPAELERAIYAVVDRDFYHNDLLISLLRKGMRNKLKAKRPDFLSDSTLTDRELEVLRLICEDHSTKEIALRLAVSEKTVSSHKLNIQTKLSVKSTVGMVRAAYELGLLQ